MTRRETVRRWLARGLLAFVLVSIGVAVGKSISTGGEADADGGAEVRDGAVVYYMHSPVRCAACNAVEAMTRELIAGEFAGDVRAGRLTFRAVDYRQNKQLAERYGVGATAVVVVRLAGGEEVSHVTLGQVLPFAERPAEFRDAVAPAIHAALEARP